MVSGNHHKGDALTRVIGTLSFVVLYIMGAYMIVDICGICPGSVCACILLLVVLSVFCYYFLYKDN